VGLERHSYLTSAVDGSGYQLHAPVALPSDTRAGLRGGVDVL